MRSRALFRPLMLTVGTLLFLYGVPAAVYAQTNPTSAQYSAKEYYFGTGGETNLTSSQYSARTATGALGVGDTAGTTNQSSTGPVTAQEEYIEFFVNSGSVNLGNATTSNTRQGTATFYVKAYVASGYAVRNASAGLAIPSHTMASPSSAVASAIGTEQFGINLTGSNTCALCLPLTSFGAAPVQVPDSTFSFGAAASGYNTANSYKYLNGDIIAQSTKSSGQTNYTVSYILNISTTTDAGSYTMNHNMVATGTY